MPLADRSVLITGATGGLGRVATAAFARTGARLGLGGTDSGRLAALAAELELADGRWQPLVADLRRPEEARAIVEQFGPVDVAIHAVGGWAGGTPVVELDHDEIRAMLDQHLWTTLNVVQAVVPGMVERRWGRVIGMSSPFAVEPGPKGASYAVAKAAEEIVLRSLAREVASAGVTVNILAARTIDAAHEREREPSARNAAWTTPEEIVAPMLFLASDEAGAISGARIRLDRRA